MQSLVTPEFPQRLTFYNARSYINQLKAGELYTTLRPSISICVLSKPLFPSSPKLHHDFRLRDESGLVFTDDVQIHLLQLTNLRTTRENLRSATIQERWAFFLRFADQYTYEELCFLFPEPEFVEAAGILEIIKQTPEENHLYSSRLKFQLDEASRIESTRIEALQEGEQKGLLKGLQEGEQKGLLHGRIELIQTLQRILNTPESTVEELSEKDESELMQMSEELQRRLRVREN